MGNICTNRKKTKRQKQQLKYEDLLMQKYQQINNQYIQMNLDHFQSIPKQSDISQYVSNSGKLQIELLNAKDNNDIKKLVNYMTNDEKLSDEIVMYHPWAKDPQTIGSVATMYLIHLMMRYEVDDDVAQSQQEENILQNIQIFKNCNGLEQIKKNLQTNQIDRIQISILLIVFLSEFESMIIDITEMNIFDYVLQFFYEKSQNPIGQRVAIGFILKEICKSDDKYKQQLIDDKKSIISIKSFIQHNNPLYIQEGLQHLDDLCFSHIPGQLQEQLNNDICQQLVDLGFLDLIKRTRQRIDVIQAQHFMDDSHDNIEQSTQINHIMDMIDGLILNLKKYAKKK